MLFAKKRRSDKDSNTQVLHRTEKDQLDQDEQIRQASRETISIWLYIAGLCVTLSGLYAVNFGNGEDSFATLTYLFAILGYVLSYVLRRMGFSIKAFQMPFLAFLVIICLLGLSSEQGLSWIAPHTMLEDRAKSLQLVFVYFTIIHCFMLNSDAAVLFACVPCMTMLALVSTQNSENQIQNAFLVFVGAATFLMVHENYLRTRAFRQKGGDGLPDNRLFSGQLQLAALCVAGALMLANIVAIPIRSVGQSLFIPNPASADNPVQSKTNTTTSANVAVSERAALDLTGGPVSELNVPLMSIVSDRGLYWRGTTFDYYTGRRFENRTGEPEPISPKVDEDTTGTQSGQNSNHMRPPVMDSSTGINNELPNHYLIPAGPYEEASSGMKGAHRTRQQVTILGGSFTQFYGAARMEDIHTAETDLLWRPAGDLYTQRILPLHTTYVVTSIVPDDDPEHLRKIKSQFNNLPKAFTNIYLQTSPPSDLPNPRLQEIVKQITSDQHNNYDRVVALKNYISQQCKYNLQATPPPADTDVVESFLLDQKQGYCDKFAASLTILCRYAGIPARLASGFQTGEMDPSRGAYIVLEKDKHAWTEVYFPSVGWVPFDATEGAEDITPKTEKSQQHFSSFLSWFTSHGVLPPLVALAALGLLGYVLKTELMDRLRRPRKADTLPIPFPPTNLEIIMAYLQACTALEKLGYGRKPHQTPAEYLVSLSRTALNRQTGFMQAFELLTSLHMNCRYSTETAEAAAVDQARGALQTVLTAIKSMPRRAAVKSSPAQVQS